MSHVDLNYLEGLPHSNREKLPEGAVHAHGAGAYGEFEVSCSPHPDPFLTDENAGNARYLRYLQH